MAQYYQRYLQKLSQYTSLEGRDAAVLGCGRGQECAALVEAGVASVTGYDLDPRIGTAFADPRVSYHCRSLLETGASSRSFDVVYSAAVFEHVHDLDAAYAEAVRICKPGGVVLVLSSPLWYSPYGNHMFRVLPQLPWCHLLFTPSQLRGEIERLPPDAGIAREGIPELVDRVFDPGYFNRLPASAYVAAVDRLRRIEVIQSRIWAPPLDPLLTGKYLAECLRRGFVEAELKAGAHFFVAKPG